jgi:peptidoglycan hydrolase-like protein with peptidoglycan-binding domain
VVIGAGATAVVVAGTWVGVSMASGSGSPAASASTAKTATATVDRGDLVATTAVDGTLGYAGSRTVAARAAGTLTWLAGEGAVVRPGHRLYAVDGNPTVLMKGRVPAYRTLQAGDEGADVRQLERGLQKLGYDGFTVDDSYTSSTAAAVKEWQDDLGVAKTGVVQLGAVVFAPGAVRVGSHALSVGAVVAPGAAITTVSATRRVVSVDLPVSDATYVKRGGHVTVTLPDGDTVNGHVSSVGRVAQSSTDDQGGGESTIDVEVALSSKRISALDEAPVSVDIETARANNVLSVPVDALLALAEGGYGVEVAHGATTSVVTVDPGLFANGRVEVTGSINVGDRVVVPSS